MSTNNSTKSNYILNIEEHQYLTFLLDKEIYAIEVLKVKEIIGFSSITPVPSMINCIKGVTNVRGNVIPIVSLPLRLGFPETPTTNKTCIIILTIDFQEEKIDIGIVVDMVNQVFDILPENIEPTPIFGANLRKDFIKKVGKVNGKFITILDAEGVLNVDELSICRTSLFKVS